MDTQKVRSIVGNAVVGVGDVVLFTPYNDVVVCNPKFESALAIIDYVSDNRNEVCLHTFDNRGFMAIKVDYIKVLDYQDIKMVINEAIEYHNKMYYEPELQVVIDLMDDFYHLITNYEDDTEIRDDTFGSLAYDIDCIIDVFRFDRDDDYKCSDLSILKTLYNYAHLLQNWINR